MSWKTVGARHGRTMNDVAEELVADAAAQEIETLSDIRGSAAYKREMVRVHTRRALARALGGPR